MVNTILKKGNACVILILLAKTSNERKLATYNHKAEVAHCSYCYLQFLLCALIYNSGYTVHWNYLMWAVYDVFNSHI